MAWSRLAERSPVRRSVLDLHRFAPVSGKTRTREKTQVIVLFIYYVFLFEANGVAWQLQEICTAP
jgi:hypothetical protein